MHDQDSSSQLGQKTAPVKTVPQDKVPQDTVSIEEAQASLRSLNQIERDTNASVRPPLWLSAIIAGAYAMITFSWASIGHDNLWALGLIGSAVVFTLALAFYYYSCRLLGIKPKSMPTSRPEMLFQIVLAVFFGVTFVLTRILTESGNWWAAYVGAALNGLVLLYSMHNYATGEYIARDLVREGCSAERSERKNDD